MADSQYNGLILKAGAGLELRFRLAPLEDHDQALTARHARPSKDEKAVVEQPHCRNVEKFAANARKR